MTLDVLIHLSQSQFHHGQIRDDTEIYTGSHCLVPAAALGPGVAGAGLVGAGSVGFPLQLRGLLLRSPPSHSQPAGLALEMQGSLSLH